MKQDYFDRSFFDLVAQRARLLEEKLNSDVVFYHGPILSGYFRPFRDFIEEVKEKSKKSGASRKTISVVLRTAGGSAEITERMVGVLRKHYNQVYFLVPDVAMSAGTILCMSGDKIYMDYASSLGPIDPQVQLPDTGDLVPALGYIDKVAEILKKPDLYPGDVIFLKNVDLARLALFEQGRELSIQLLKKWLVDYKFKNWHKHRTTNKGQTVTKKEKEARAEKIAKGLSDHKRWHSHGRNLDVKKLQQLGIEIDDYSDNPELKEAIRSYNDPMTGFIDRSGFQFYLHNAHVES